MKIDLGRKLILTKVEEIPHISKKLANKEAVKAIYLFGSQATGKTHKFSDIDLCIITNGKEIDGLPITDNLDISYFHNLPLIIQFRVLKEGKPLFVRDKKFIENVKIKTLKKYHDFMHIVNRYVWENFKCTI